MINKVSPVPVPDVVVVVVSCEIIVLVYPTPGVVILPALTPPPAVQKVEPT